MRRFVPEDVIEDGLCASQPSEPFDGQLAEAPFRLIARRPAPLMCGKISLSAPVPAHWHDFYLLAFVLAGSAQHEDQAGAFPTIAGDVWVVLPGQRHAYSRIQGSLSLFNLAVSRPYLVECAPLLGESPWPRLLSKDQTAFQDVTVPPTHVRLSVFELNKFRPLLEQLKEELENQRASERPGVSAGLLLQILGLLGPHIGSGLHAEAHFDSPEDGGILAAVRYLEERYMGPLTVEELAEQAGYTPTYLTRKFRRRLGMSPSEYLLNLRIRHACTLLLDSNLSIGDIASHIGFRDSQYFATRFHLVMGMTPSAFRAQPRSESQTE